ncbi:MAG: nitrate ABC transporter ATP-binding protein [Coxiellaceae bacterium]|nr:nitrate ABC transporter ATP-binding protein [Coxiellaceae bacterium]|tara:strand:+ start:11162 stop:12469 length:1308 start_codon:yes stop_codon:yes gene_type:complete
MSTVNPSIIEIRQVKKSFQKRRVQELLVLDDVNFSMRKGEIIALLGKSGSGKSTLLRIIAGLIAATDGEVVYHGEPITSPVDGLTMVFQHFALLPWLTVLQNVELGLEARGIKRQERRKKALEAIDVVGLDGFESAYPKELSGGMSQRVGLARALVVDPEVLLMDEPFSALDVLTAEKLRGDLIDLWASQKTNIQSILIVTHNIEEAVFLADRILVFDSDPGQVRDEVAVSLTHPRNDTSDEFRAMVDHIYTLMTTDRHDAQSIFVEEEESIATGYRLPNVEIAEITGFLEMLSSPEYDKSVDLPQLAEELHLELDDLFSITETLELLRFATVSQGDIQLTVIGRSLAEADILIQKKIFAKQLLEHVPLAKHIRESLDQQDDHRLDDTLFLKELERDLSEQAAEEVLKVVIEWGRYAEIFAYDSQSGYLSLENPQ